MSATADFWCHQCKKHIKPISAEQEDEEFMCPTCHSNFIEMIEEATDEELLQSAMDTVFSDAQPQQNQPPTPPPQQNTGPIFQQFTFGPNGFQQPQQPFQIDFNAIMNLFMPPQQNPNQQTQQNSPFMFNMNNLMQMLTNDGDQQGGAPVVMGDYVFGGNFDQIIQQMLDRFDGPIGTPPASAEAIKKLETTVVSEECRSKNKRMFRLPRSLC